LGIGGLGPIPNPQIRIKLIPNYFDLKINKQ